jgi:hypothetical protein
MKKLIEFILLILFMSLVIACQSTKAVYSTKEYKEEKLCKESSYSYSKEGFIDFSDNKSFIFKFLNIGI